MMNKLQYLIKLKNVFNKNVFCWFAPFGYLYFSYFSMIEPELGAGINPGMALTLTISI
jgi:hypothetical protein